MMMLLMMLMMMIMMLCISSTVNSWVLFNFTSKVEYHAVLRVSAAQASMAMRGTVDYLASNVCKGKIKTELPIPIIL